MSRSIPAEIEYPSSDGQPMAENDWQREAILYGISTLRYHYRDWPDVYASGDLLLYYEEGNPKKAVASDVFVVCGAAKHFRMTYKLWDEPKAPDFVMEVASASTWKQDVGEKRGLYARLGVREYWLYDPRGEYYQPPLRGLRLEDGTYQPLPARVEGGARVVHSEVLGLDLRVDGERLRFRDPATGQDLRTLQESETRLEQEVAARHAAEAQIAELQARLRAESGKA